MKKSYVLVYLLSHAAALAVGFAIAVFTLSAFRPNIISRSEREITDKLTEAVRVIDSYYVGDYDPQTLSDRAISAMVDGLGDRWSYYMTRDELESFVLASMNRYDGLGVVLQSGDDGILIVEVYGNSPAAAAGLEPGCLITAVNGEDITAMEYEAAVAFVKGLIAEGTVTMTATMPDGTVKDVSVTPGSFEIDPVSYELLDGGMGLITISNFEDKCAEQMQAAARQLIGQGAEALIFDVRNNPGGQLAELLDALDFLLPEGPIFTGRDAFGYEETKMSDEACLDIPMAVLINGSTYSAAEFFAAALEEYEWAYTVGEKTSGKGYAQVTVTLSDGGAIHISSIEYFTPKGKSLADVGLTPYAEVEMGYDDTLSLYYGTLAHEDDAQLLKAEELLSGELKKAS